MKYPVFSFFSGAGFLDMGFEDNGFEVVYVNELHKPFLKTYQHSREVMRKEKPRFGYHQGDITELMEQEQLQSYIEEIKKESNLFGFIGGPPCPDFSVGGKNKGREGENGKLSETYVDLICQHTPSFFLFENVKGLWRTKRHREFFEEMKAKLHANGYFTTERLINSLEYGTPQHRERIILLGFRQEVLKHYNFQKEFNSYVLPQKFFPWLSHMKYNMEDIKRMPWPITNEFHEDSILSEPIGIATELTVEYWLMKNNTENHPNGLQFFKPRAGLAKFLKIEEGDDSKKSYKRLHRWRYSSTAAYGNNEVHLHPYKARRISVAEALAIQSMPPQFEIPSDISLTDAFKTIGNGVPYLASLGIAKTIHDFLGMKKLHVNSV
ncbi:DNA cytosine methyltransferase [Bacillus sp. ISL-39]|uniref:DNA cytosine methyltransferase n=1 Tax=Bacillus sp. ISL-39 TaxID=2819124 RepID=UPI001BEA0797|nr:DNA cytosine methyltransferase [Bacillus sp. ISL-39]MBT2636701.1 DNA cytosine methyltransferase [Bacillus sp. ISL-39]